MHGVPSRKHYAPCLNLFSHSNYLQHTEESGFGLITRLLLLISPQTFLQTRRHYWTVRNFYTYQTWFIKLSPECDRYPRIYAPWKNLTVCTVHRNQLYKQTNTMLFCMYLFYNFCTVLHVSNDHFVHHQEFMIYCILQLFTNHAHVPNWSVLRLEMVWVTWVLRPNGNGLGYLGLKTQWEWFGLLGY